MRFDILTIFPKIFDSYFSESILRRAQEKKLIKIQAHDIRDYARCEKHQKARPTRTGAWCGRCGRVDDRPFGGGAGMVMTFPPIAAAVKAIKLKVYNVLKVRKVKTRIILFSTRGKKFTNADAKRLAKYDQLILICGRYEGVDERVAEYVADEEISIGDYVLTGGEIPAMVLVDSVSRQIPGVLGKSESLEEKQGSYPTYTRPAVIEIGDRRLVIRGKNGKSRVSNHQSLRRLRVPKVLLSGVHRDIAKWRFKGDNKR